jgi:malate synthase
MSAPIHAPLSAPLPCAEPDLLTREALAFVKSLTLCFRGSLKALLAEREQAQAGFDRGGRPGLLRATGPIRQDDWSVAPLPVALMDRRVEIIGPPAPGALAAALHSGARGAVADFEDRLSPTLDNLVSGQQTLHRAVRGVLSREVPPGPGSTALMVRPRGLHLQERHLAVEGEPVPACLFDAGLFLWHNAREMLARGAVPHLCLPKLEHHLEARWWNRVLEAVENDLGLPACCIRTTLAIDTLPAAFQMDEILHEHRHRAVGLNLGEGCLSSFIRTLGADPAAVTPDRGEGSMAQPFLRAWTRLLVRTCHRRGCLALGGLCAILPEAGDPDAAAQAARVRAGQEREILDGCDGTWVAHPALVPLARAVFDERMPGLNQLHRIPGPVAETDLLQVPAGPRTGRGLRQNLRVGIRYLEAWLNGEGSVALYGLLEDAAGAELARMQLWQWVKHDVEVAGCGSMDRPLFHWHVQDALYQIQAEVGDEAFAEGRYLEAADLLETQILLPAPPPYLIPAAYDLLMNPVLSEVN